MKMVKSLLLGSAAGLVAVTAGQAADLPVKAKPVEYVKVCSLYGAGFYYMPGTDMCIKVGGWVRVEATYGNNNGSMTWGPYSGQENTRLTSNLVTRERGYITADAREQTAYGTARAYIDVGLSDSDTAFNTGIGTFSSNRAFLQWAGFTAGLTQSFYDFYSGPASLYRAAFIPQEDTGDGGQWVWAYTAQFGNGLSATISAEQRRTTQIYGLGPTSGVQRAGFFRKFQGHVQRFGKFFDLDGLGEVAKEAGLEAQLDVAQHGIRAQGDDGNVRHGRVFAEDFHGFDAADAGKVDVHEDHVRHRLPRQFNAESPVDGLYKFDVRALLNELLDEHHVRGVVLDVEEGALA